MPLIPILMSASSSTIRMSCAMNHRFRLLQPRALRRSLAERCRRREDQADPGPAARAVVEQQFACVVFHDLLHDGKTKPGTLVPCRDVRLRQALPPMLRQALAVILDAEPDPAGAAGEADADM